jgi:class II aldolase/adducin N-terminal domain-containing protein
VSEYVKFTSERVSSELSPFSGLVEVNIYRRRLLELQLIGVDASGVSFGNLSIRDGETNNFYITGSATGGKSKLTPADCARVVAYDFETNWLRYAGSAIPSSESFTHAAIYESDKTAGAVLHCHDLKFWAALLDQVPTSSNSVHYGTPEMAHEIMRLFRVTDVHRRRIVAMAGHKGGIVTFGRDLEHAFAVLMQERMASPACIDSAFHQRTPARRDR